MLALCACSDPITIDEPPNPDELVRPFDEPDGRVDEAAGARLGRAVDTAVQELRRLEPLEVVPSVAESTAALSLLEDLEFDSEPLDPGPTPPLARDDLVAALSIDFICPGWGGSEGDGRIALRGAVDDLGLYPVLWGEFAECRFPLFDARLELTGELAVVVDAGNGRISSRELSRAPKILGLRAQALVNDEDAGVFDTLIRYETTEGAGAEIRTVFETDDGSFVLATAAEVLEGDVPPTVNVVVVGADGLWQCTIDSGGGTGACFSTTSSSAVTW